MADNNGRRRKNWLSVISLIISIIALGISGGNFYFQYFYRYDDLKATILSISPDIPGAACTVDIVFTNNGNRECSVVSVDLEETGDTLGEGYFWIPCLNQSPFSIKPNEVISKQFQMGGGDLKKSGLTNLDKGMEREWRLAFGVVDSNGNYYKIKLPVFTNTVGDNFIFNLKVYPLILKLLPSPVEKHFFQFTRPPSSEKRK
jgi:hypothetical protein